MLSTDPRFHKESWEKEETWKIIRESYRLMLDLGLKTQFVQSAYSECYIAWALKQTGYEVQFHPSGCDMSFKDKNGKKINVEVKHSQVNKQPNNQGHGYESWKISEKQMIGKKFDYLILVKDRFPELDDIYVFTRHEIEQTKEDEDGGWYIWDAEYLDEIKDRSKNMRESITSVTESLHINPEKYKKRWINILQKKELDEGE
jgi:hypothetical protein